jgi:hypothetical protein
VSRFDGMTPQEIRDWAEQEREKSRAAFAGKPLPRISRVKRDDHPHWELVGCDFHVTAGKRVLVDRGDGQQAEGVLQGLQKVGSADVLVVELDRLWATERTDGKPWAPVRDGRVRVDDFRVEVLARPVDAAGEPQTWTLQTNLEGQP